MKISNSKFQAPKQPQIPNSKTGGAGEKNIYPGARTSVRTHPRARNDFCIFHSRVCFGGCSGLKTALRGNSTFHLCDTIGAGSFWNLKFGTSLGLGIWNLELRQWLLLVVTLVCCI